MPKGEHFYNRWVDKVVDGTKCSMDSYDICVDGKCEVRNKLFDWVIFIFVFCCAK